MPDISLELAVDRDRIAPQHPSPLQIVAEIGALGAATRRPLSVALALDVSPSMKGPPIAQVLDATRRIIDLCRPEDALALVTFAEDARVLVPLGRMTAQHRALCKRALTAVGLRWATNIGAGLELAAAVLREADPATGRALLLLSDGAPNVGLTEPGQLGELSRRARGHTSVTTLGFGAHHDDRVLAAIAESGGGSYRFIHDPATCGFELVQAFGAQADVAARDLRLTVEAAPGVRIVGTSPQADAQGVIALPDLMAGERRLVLVDVEVGPAAASDARLTLVRATLAAEPAIRLEATARIELAATDGPRLRTVHRRALQLRAEDARVAARRAADRGDFAEAARRTEAMIETIRGLEGGVEPGEPLYEALDQLVDDASLYRQRPDADAYAAFRRGQRADLGTAQASAAANQPRSEQARAVALSLAGVTADAALVFPDGHRVPVPVDGMIGRSATCDVVVRDSQVSRQHAHVFALAGDFWISDMGSANTTMVNGERLREPVRLTEGDRVELGTHVLRFTLR